MPRTHEARGFADPLDDAMRARTTRRPGRARTATSTGPRRWPTRYAAAQPPQVRRVPPHAARRSSRASARSRPRRPGSGTTIDGALVPAFHAALPFPLTGDQAAAIDEIAADMARPAPMHRLLQGEVGSGKTVVALTALLTAVQGGYQGAFMAPTEVLAEQHELTMRSLLGGLTVRRRGHAARRAAGAGRAAHQPHAGGGAAAHRRRSARGRRSTSSSARTR